MNNNNKNFEVSENPSLIDLYNFVNDIYPLLSNYEKDMFNENTFGVIEYYIYGRMTGALHGLLSSDKNKIDIQFKKKQPTFYLGGHILYETNKPITKNMVDSVQDKINKIDMTQCWGMEIYSVMEHNGRFETFKTFYKNYKNFIEHIKYLPNNIGFNEAKEHFELTIN